MPPTTRNEYLSTRTSLLSRLKHFEDSQSWREFFDAYWRLIYGVALKAGLTDAEAQDVVQETIIAVARNIRQFEYDPMRSFKAWLLNTARWKIADQFRKRLPVREHAPHPADKTSTTTTLARIADAHGFPLETIWDEEWKSNLEYVALERLKRKANPKHYQIFDLYVLRNWPVEKVMRTLRISADQIYKVKSRLVPLLKMEIDYLQTRVV